jgi:hypothetical protein
MILLLHEWNDTGWIWKELDGLTLSDLMLKNEQAMQTWNHM